MSTMNQHPLRKAKEAQVLAVRFGIEKWGFIRIHRGSALGIWDKWTKRPVAIPSEISSIPEKWYCHYLSPKQDEIEMIDLGLLPFLTDDDAWAPPCYYPPDVFQNHYRIYFRGMFREAREDEVEGMFSCERLNPGKLVAKLQTLDSGGFLKEIPSSGSC